MTKKFNLLVCIAFITTFVFGQDVSISSKVVDEEGLGVAYATIGIIKHNYGIVTFEDGSFSLDVRDRYMEEILVISALGYEKKEIAYQEFVNEKPIEIVLKESPFLLEEVTVAPSEIKLSRIGVNKKKSSNNYSVSSPLRGVTIARLFDDIKEPILLKEVSVVVGKENINFFQLRCRIFSVNKQNGMPDKDILSKSVILGSVKNTETLTFSLEEDLWLDEPFFVGFEWISTKKQFEEMQNILDAYPTKFLNKIVAENPGLTPSINENKRVRFHNSSNKLVKEVKLTKAQTKILNERNERSPILNFKILSKGNKTYYGSPITRNWALIPHEALISALIGERVPK